MLLKVPITQVVVYTLLVWQTSSLTMPLARKENVQPVTRTHKLLAEHRSGLLQQHPHLATGSSTVDFMN